MQRGSQSPRHQAPEGHLHYRRNPGEDLPAAPAPVHILRQASYGTPGLYAARQALRDGCDPGRDRQLPGKPCSRRKHPEAMADRVSSRQGSDRRSLAGPLVRKPESSLPAFASGFFTPLHKRNSSSLVTLCPKGADQSGI